MLALAVVVALCFNRPNQLLNATSIEGGIQDRQVLKYQPSRLIFWYLLIINGIK